MFLNAIRILKLRAKGWKIGRKVTIGKKCVFDATNGQIGDNTTIGDNCRFKAKNIKIGSNCIIFSGFYCFCLQDFVLGNRCKISHDVSFYANNIVIGSELWCNENVEVGGGGWKKSTANLSVGDYVHIGKGASINVCSPVTIGSCTGIGIESMIFTHSAGNGQSIIHGYKHIEKEVSIGNHVSVFTRAIIAPGSRVEDGVTLAALSFFSGKSDKNALYAGIPAVLKKKISVIPENERIDILYRALSVEIHDLFTTSFTSSNLKEKVLIIEILDDDIANQVAECGCNIVICLKNQCMQTHQITVFDVEKQSVAGKSNHTTEIVRDSLRRNGLIFRYDEYTPLLLSYNGLVEAGIERK